MVVRPDPPSVTCPACGNEQEMRDDWRDWIRERKSHKSNKVTHECEKDSCDYTYSGHVDGFLDIFPLPYYQDKNGCW